MLPEDQKRILGYFIEEAKDHLNTIEQGLINLQTTVGSPETVNEVFRAAHSVKGGAAMLGLESIQRTSHRLEDYFKVLKEAPVQPDRQLESMLLQIFDGLQEQLEQLQGPFGLTDEKAQEIMANIEPVFERVDRHLGSLTQDGPAVISGQPIPVQPPAPEPRTTTSYIESSALQLVFTSDVPALLREMLEIFKRTDSDASRQQLQSICQRMYRIGEQFELSTWCQITDIARRVMANREETYRTIAPIVIRELKAAQDLIIRGGGEQIYPSEALLNMLPFEELEPTDLQESDLDVLLQGALQDSDEGDDLADLLGVDGSNGDAADGESATTDDLESLFEAPLGSSDTGSPPAGSGPEVGMAELNSLADLFEGEADLNEVWEEEDITDSAGSAGEPDGATALDGDFADLLLERVELTEEASESSADDLEALFGDSFMDEPAERDSDDELSAATADTEAVLDEILDFSEDAIEPVDVADGSSDGEVVDWLIDDSAADASDETEALGALFAAENSGESAERMDFLDDAEADGNILADPWEFEAGEPEAADGVVETDAGEPGPPGTDSDTASFNQLWTDAIATDLPSESAEEAALLDFDDLGLDSFEETASAAVADPFAEAMSEDLSAAAAPEAESSEDPEAMPLELSDLDSFNGVAEDFPPPENDSSLEADVDLEDITASLDDSLVEARAEIDSAAAAPEPGDLAEAFGSDLRELAAPTPADSEANTLDQLFADEVESTTADGPDAIDSFFEVEPPSASSSAADDIDLLDQLAAVSPAEIDAELDLGFADEPESPEETAPGDGEADAFGLEMDLFDAEDPTEGLPVAPAAPAENADEFTLADFEEAEQGAAEEEALGIAGVAPDSDAESLLEMPESSTDGESDLDFADLDLEPALPESAETSADLPEAELLDLDFDLDDEETAEDTESLELPSDLGFGDLEDSEADSALSLDFGEMADDSEAEDLGLGEFEPGEAAAELAPELGDFDALLAEEASFHGDSSGPLTDATHLEAAPTSAGPYFDEDMPPSAGPFDPPEDGADDEFEDLEKLLEEADQLGGSAPTMGIRRASGSTPRRGNRRSTVPSNQTMRVSVLDLDNLSNLVGELVVNRNSLEQDQDRLRQFLENLLLQVQLLNDVGQRMRDLYERSLLESSLISSRQAFQSARSTSFGEPDDHATGVTFDALEMDRFTGFHTLTQEMIELIVRVREAASDIGFTIDSADNVTRQFRQVTTQLQEGLNKARMVPFTQTADRLPRAVRDISLKCGKEARLMVEGRDTLIDKMILERLYDPMTHLVNNAITHGIEIPQEREATGKPREGTITVRAFYQGNQTVIYIADDGAGINPDTVREKALSQGLITADEAQQMTKMELYELLFLPGFTTRDQADDFAGRGVGMDVVRTALAEIRGAITIDSELGQGTSFTIRLPLTLSISKALSCVNNMARIAFPMDGVEDMFDAPQERIQENADGQLCIPWRDTLLPFRPLSDLLQFNRTLGRGRVYGSSHEDDMVSIVVLRSANAFIALQVDQVIGEQEIVIKQLEGPVPKPTGIAGATVLGDGRVMPIADVLELIDLSVGRVRREAASSLWPQEGQPPEAEATTSEPTVLIVDDSITVRELLSMSFNKMGYRVEQARDGQEAWDKLRSGLPCDLVFCDIEMPRMDGLELLSRLQKDSHLRHIPIAMLTSRGADRHRQMAVDLGAKGYFTKPYLEEVLLDAAQRMLNGENMA